MAQKLPTKQLYDEEKRGTKAPVYTAAEEQYRSDRLTELQNAYVIREQNHMELNNMPYSEYYLINRQMDLAYNPPKVNPQDSRLISGLVHEKDQTILSILMDMNFQPKVTSLDPNNRMLIDACNIFTAKIKTSLKQDNFRDKLENMLRMLISQGNVFATNKKVVKNVAKKIRTSPANMYNKITWKTVIEKEADYCTTETLPNTAVFPMNIMDNYLKTQPRIYYVMNYPTSYLAQIWKDNPRWENVPKTPTRTVPVNVDGIWGDYYLQLPAKDYSELIIMESETYNEYQAWINGVQMLPIQEENGVVTGYPLTEVSPSGCYSLCKGDYERIPFFFFSKSNPAKNQVKEEELNEVMRLMVLFLRQKAAPAIGNNTDKILQSNIWDPNTIIPDIRKEDLSILTPHNGIGNAEFSFYEMLQKSISESSVSASVEGTNTEDTTATQYVDQKKENLKKLGLSIDRTVDFLRQMYWLTLFNEMHLLDQKVKKYNPDTDSFTEAYMSFSAEDSVDGRKGTVQVNLTDDIGGIDPYSLAKEEVESPNPTKIYHATPDYLQKIIKNMKDQLYMEVVAEPDGQQQSLLAVLFNLLTQYVNLKGGDNRKINFDYLETIIADNSGFDPSKVFLDEVMESPTVQTDGGMPAEGGTPGKQNNILANAK